MGGTWTVLCSLQPGGLLSCSLLSTSFGILLEDHGKLRDWVPIGPLQGRDTREVQGLGLVHCDPHLRPD